MRKIWVFVVIFAVIIVGLGGWYFISQKPNVSQVTPSPTPANPPVTSDMQPSPIASSSSQLPTPYITAVDWPPERRVENEQYHCTEAGSQTDRAGQTVEMRVNSHEYCVTKITEGAAGSIYIQYAYARPKNNQTEYFTFSLRFIQCDNYPEEEKAVCEKAQQTFITDNYVDQYIQSNF